MMLKKKVDGLEDYYYQWMNKYKDDADRRLVLLKRLMMEANITTGSPDLIPLIKQELADEK